MYTEDQMLPAWLMVAVVLIAAGVFIGPLFFSWHAGRLNPGMLWVLIGPLAISLLLVCLRLQTHLDDDKITARIWPFSSVQLKFTDIRNVEEIEYSPMADFGGWGIRYGLGGKIYSMRGSKAVKIILSSGKIVYLGTQEPRKLSADIRANLAS